MALRNCECMPEMTTTTVARYIQSLGQTSVNFKLANSMHLTSDIKKDRQKRFVIVEQLGTCLPHTIAVTCIARLADVIILLHQLPL